MNKAKMSEELVHSENPVLLVGGGPIPQGALRAAKGRYGCIVAADGGADRAREAGLEPEVVIGDMDSVSPAARSAAPRLIRVAEQDSTDFEKCLTRIRAPLILGVGFLGGRVDHELAALSAVVRHSDVPCVLIGDEDVVAHVPAALHLQLEPTTRVSLFPMAEVQGRSTGLEWPVDGLRLAPGGVIGTSNRATSGPVTLDLSPGCLILLPTGALGPLLRGLAASR